MISCARLRDAPDPHVPSHFRHLQLLALDPYDLALSKLTRDADRDRRDVENLGTAVALDVRVVRDRYQREMRAYGNVPERDDLTLELWIEMILERQTQAAP